MEKNLHFWIWIHFINLIGVNYDYNVCLRKTPSGFKFKINVVNWVSCSLGHPVSTKHLPSSVHIVWSNIFILNVYINKSEEYIIFETTVCLFPEIFKAWNICRPFWLIKSKQISFRKRDHSMPAYTLAVCKQLYL